MIYIYISTGQLRGGPHIQFGDIAQNSNRNAATCTARGCTWRKSRNHVYVPIYISTKFSKSGSSKSAKCVNSEIFYMGIQSMTVVASPRSHLSVCLKATLNDGLSFAAWWTSTQSPVFALSGGDVNGTTSISILAEGRNSHSSHTFLTHTPPPSLLLIHKGLLLCVCVCACVCVYVCV